MAFNILIVDDSKVVRSIIEKTLRMAKVPLGEVHQAANGQEALELIEKHWMDLIFADINMPVMSGVEMIRQLCNNGVTKSIPIIVISTEGSETRIDELRQLGVSAYLRKPIAPEQLSAIVNEILGKPGHV